MVNCSSWYYFLYNYILIFIQYCSNACVVVVDCCKGTTRPWVVFCAHSPFPKTFMQPSNSTSVQCCISTNLFQWSLNDGDCIAVQNFNLNACRLFGLHDMSQKIFCFIFGQLWHREILTKQPQKLPRSLCNSSDYTLLANKTWFQPVFFQACAGRITSGITLVISIFILQASILPPKQRICEFARMFS